MSKRIYRVIYKVPECPFGLIEIARPDLCAACDYARMLRGVLPHGGEIYSVEFIGLQRT